MNTKRDDLDDVIPARRAWLPTPTELPDYPLNPSPPKEIPDFGSMGVAKYVKFNEGTDPRAILRRKIRRGR